MSTDLLTHSMGYADRFVDTFYIYSPHPNTSTNCYYKFAYFLKK